ncbi:hypothetical protein ACR79S_11975 [Sphingobacterium spiritivorum]|uniref:hypothetical protein n=1 Tax=Sphingobacterium spiritivorum TaxID=258 RepID=UPI003DA45687
MTLVKQIELTIKNVLDLLFNSESELTSPRAKEIMSNPKDREKVMEAIDKLREKRFQGDIHAEETVVLSDDKTITIIS